MERPSLIIVEDASNGGAVVQHHITRGVVRDAEGLVFDRGLSRDRFRRGGPRRGTPPAQHRPFDAPQAPHRLAHLDLGVAVRLQHRLGHIA